jgi:DNA mismatch repair protein MutL
VAGREAFSHGGLDLAKPPTSGEDVVNPEFLSLSTVGQLWGEFLIAQGGAGPDGAEFYIIDQHGAAERCAFERLRKRYRSKKEPARQMLLLPERIEASSEETAAINEAAAELDALGFEVEPFGPSTKSSGETFLVRSVPEILAGRPASRLVVDIAMELAGAGGSTAAEAGIESVLMTVACHSVIRGPRPLTREEGDALLRELSTIDFAAHCPHGRPVVKRYTRGEVESLFKR